MDEDGAVTALPAKGLARAMGVLAMAGSALSLSVHTLAVIGIYSRAILDFESYLFVGSFPVLIFASLAYNRLLAHLPFGDRSRIYNPIVWFRVARKITGSAPKWLRVVSSALLLYAGARSLLSVFERSSERVVADANGLGVLSALVAAFLAMAATILISYAGTEHPLRPDEL